MSEPTIPLDAEPLGLLTADGVALLGLHSPGPDREVAVVVAHGFSGSTERPDVRRIVERLSAYAGVLAPDLRGHGRSEGRTTLGAREVLDVDAAVAAARALGYRQVVTCGWSMGGSAVLRHAGLGAAAVDGHPVLERPDAVVSVSAPSAWFVRDSASVRRLTWLVSTPAGRAVTRLAMGTRVGRWDSVPESPVEAVGGIAPIPLLLVHGDSDDYFSVEHARALLAAAGEPAELWVLPGGRHAEAAATPELLDRLGRHLATLLARAPAGRV